MRFIAAGDKFIQAKPCPTDITDLRQVDPGRFQAKLRTGFLREYSLIAGLYRLTRVQDRNGNSVMLEYQAGKLARIRGQNKGSINIGRDRAGRIISIKGDNGRRVSYEYNESGQLTKVIDLGGNYWRYEYNELGKLSRAANPLGTDFGVRYDGEGTVTELQGSGLDYRYRYETSAGRTTVTDGNGFESVYTQNGDGITNAITNVAGVKTSLMLNEGNTVQKLYRNSALQAELRYDGEGRLVSLVKYDSHGPTQMNYVYDAIGRLAEIRSIDDRIAFRYDERGNLLERLNRDGMVRYTYSPAGDLLMMNFGDAISLRFEVDADGQITSVMDKQNRQTRFKYENDGKLSEARFADGSVRTYQYDQLGMRRLRQFDTRARVDYAHNATGSLTEIQVRSADGTTDGQRLTLDDDQKVSVIERLTGTKSYLTYDRMGNLTAVTTGDRILRFSYDRFNRLTEVAKPNGERLSYGYTDGEQDLRVQMDHHTGRTVSDRVTSGVTFSSGLELLRNRAEGSLFGAVRFDRAMIDYRLTSELGVIFPDAMQNSSIMRMRIMRLGESAPEYQKSFDAPSNVMFIPPEYGAVNCCPICVTPRGGDEFADPCPSCDPGESGGEQVELYYKFESSRPFPGPDNRPMKECIYINCPGNRGKRCYSDAGYSDFREGSDPCATGISLVTEYLGSFFGFERCRIISHYDFFGPFQCP